MEQIVVSASLIGFLSFGAHGQVVTVLSVFEVASVKLNRTGIRGGSMDFPKEGEKFTATNMPFGAPVLIVYRITVRPALRDSAVPFRQVRHRGEGRPCG
jgi:hypothetical protein